MATAAETLRRHALLGLGLALAAVSAPAQDRPLLTERATTAPAGRLVLETGVEVITDEPSYVTGVRRTRWGGPLLHLVYSPAANIELDVEWVARVGVSGEEGRGDIASSDWGDVTLRAKWRILEERGHRPAVGARFGVVWPQTSFEDQEFNPLGLGPNTLRAFAEALLTQPVGRGLLHVNAGLYVHDEVYRPHDQRDFLSYGVAVEWPLGRRLGVLAEVAGRAGDGMPGAEQRSEARAGARLGIGPVRVDAAVRRGLAAADGSWGLTAGLSWTPRSRRTGT